MDERDYALLKRAADPRWTNASRRAAQKALADAGALATAVKADGRRLADRADAGRLTELKSSVEVLGKSARRAVARQNMDRILVDVPKDGQRALYDRMESAAAVERSLAEKLSHARQRLDTQRIRVAEKTARMARLRAAAARARSPVPPAPREPPAGPVPPATMDKTVDALRIANRQVTRTCDLIAGNMAMRDKLNDRLTADVRQQAATVLELLAYGTYAQQEAAAFNRQYCDALTQHGREARKNYAKHQRLSQNVAVVESIRKKKIVGRLQADDDKIGDGLFGDDRQLAVRSGSRLASQGSECSAEFFETNPWVTLNDWIASGEMNRQMYRDPSETTSGTVSGTSGETDSRFENSYTFPEEKTNWLLSGDEDVRRTRAMEAADYVCKELGFSNIEEVLEYFSTVKNMELRLKKMISVRKHLFEIVRTGVDNASQLETDAINYLPRTIMKLDKDIERIRRDGLEVQAKKQNQMNDRIFEYMKLFNELWFHLDNMVVKLERCQVPVVRKYQLRKKNQTECTRATMDAHRMLESLQLSIGVDSGGVTVGNVPCALVSEAADRDDRRNCRSSRISGVDACRKLVAVLHAKVKACMVHIGGGFDATDDKQLAARAYFEYNQQYHVQRAALEKKLRLQRTRLKQLSSDGDGDGDGDGENEMTIKADKSKTAIATARAAAGLKTREQAKQESEAIVEWFMTPKDSDDAKRTRKPISFRRSRIIV
ncbi:Hypothetical protein CINCED_3A014946 [Cinara cedri]|uniref:Uncharacterized protein n=1 Tax=Cinara cedri TaxID=506608 RepID=A0A5E4M8I2_9HEMI|nr:Hypothetical protein CINCED_3A014946 [Cinara cedri]